MQVIASQSLDRPCARPDWPRLGSQSQAGARVWRPPRRAAPATASSGGGPGPLHTACVHVLVRGTRSAEVHAIAHTCRRAAERLPPRAIAAPRRRRRGCACRAAEAKSATSPIPSDGPSTERIEPGLVREPLAAGSVGQQSWNRRDLGWRRADDGGRPRAMLPREYPGHLSFGLCPCRLSNIRPLAGAC